MLCSTRYDAGGVVLFRLCCAPLDMMLGVWYSPDLRCATLDMMLVCGPLQIVLFYTRYDAGCVALYRGCCATLDMMLVCATLQTVLYHTRYDALGGGGWLSSDSAVLH